METRASNKTAHPGRVAKAPPRRTTATVQEERTAKAEAKAALTEAKKKSIKRAAEFERDDIANKDVMDVTPHPPFTPKPRPLRNRKANHTSQSNLNPIKESSDVEMTDDCDQSVFIPPNSEGSVVGDSEVESAVVPSPAKKRKAETGKGALLKAATTKKGAIAKTAGKKATVKSASKKKIEESDVEMVDSEAEPVKVPKPKKEKVRVRDEINIAAKAIEGKDLPGNKYANMVKSMLSNGGKAGGEPAIKAPSLSQGIAVGKKKVQKEVSLSFEKQTAIDPWADQRSKQNKTDDLAAKSNSSPKKRKYGQAINDWASTIPSHAKPTSQAPSHSTTHTKSTSGRSVIPSLTNSTSHSSAPSVLTKNIRIVSQEALGLVKVKPEPVLDTIAINSDGGLSENDETNGEEREVAIKSPPKGKKRITSEQLILQKPSKAAETTSKKARNEDLPDWIDGKWFRHTFVTTYMAFVGQTINPWDVPVKKAIKVMQQIWDATNSHEYEITSSTIAYQKHLQDSDKERQEFCKYYLDRLRFLYEDSDHAKKSKWRGLFRNPFVLQTFAAHLTAIEGCKAIPGLHDDAKLADAATGALGLSAAAVSVIYYAQRVVLTVVRWREH
ncbi:hypothetical protein JB92DRAFT_2973067 [Gautieria morchelliformis]|nr:hypothetical protein JB92DRAFT_2973067 [Gautieria morchelliformis]